MRIFNDMPPMQPCPICNKTGIQQPGKSILLPIVAKEGKLRPTHLDCITLEIDEKLGIIFQKVDKQ